MKSSQQSANEKTILGVVSGLDSAGEKRLADRARSVLRSDEREMLKTLTLLENEPGIPLHCFRLVALAKALIRGDESRRDAFESHILRISGM